MISIGGWLEQVGVRTKRTDVSTELRPNPSVSSGALPATEIDFRS